MKKRSFAKYVLVLLLCLSCVSAIFFAVGCGDSDSSDGGVVSSDEESVSTDSGTADDGDSSSDGGTADGGNSSSDGGATDGGKSSDDSGVDVGGIAQSLINDIMVRPNIWEYLPEALWPEKMAYSSSPVLDFSSSQNVSSIGKKAIGLQLEVIYSALMYADTALEYVGTVLSVAADIATVYQTYINSNPDNYASFETTVLGFDVGIFLDGSDYTLLVGNNTISAEFDYDATTGEHGGRVQVTGGIAAKYVYTETLLRLDLSVTVYGVGYLYEMMLEKDANMTCGYTYEYIGSSSISFPTTMAVFEAYSDYTYVYSLKRQNGDLYITGYEEVYSSTTGEYLGAEVGESMGGTYDTIWFMLGDVSGFNTVKIDVSGDVYVNGSSSSFETKNYGGVNLKTASRRYDIEYKTVYYITVNNGKYEMTETQIPMLFVQYEKIDDFSSDVVSANTGTFTVTPTLPTNVVTLLKNKYGTMQTTYNSVKDSVGYNSIMEFIGDNNEFFTKESS